MIDRNELKRRAFGIVNNVQRLANERFDNPKSRERKIIRSKHEGQVVERSVQSRDIVRGQLDRLSKSKGMKREYRFGSTNYSPPRLL